MKLRKILMATLIFSGSLFAINAIQAAPKNIFTVLRVRTVPGSDQKKKDSNTVKQPASGATTTKACNQSSKYLLSSLYIGNGGTPK